MTSEPAWDAEADGVALGAAADDDGELVELGAQPATTIVASTTATTAVSRVRKAASRAVNSAPPVRGFVKRAFRGAELFNRSRPVCSAGGPR
ncbi:MAG: hypothetical protein WD402_02105, partial [Chloroflexota bacterium]